MLRDQIALAANVPVRDPLPGVCGHSEELRKDLKERKLQRTMCPIFRQHAPSGMSAVGCQATPLPCLT